MTLDTLSSDQLVTVAGGCNASTTSPSTPPTTPPPAAPSGVEGLCALLQQLLACMQSQPLPQPPATDAGTTTNPAVPNPAPGTSAGGGCTGTTATL